MEERRGEVVSGGCDFDLVKKDKRMKLNLITDLTIRFRRI